MHYDLRSPRAIATATGKGREHLMDEKVTPAHRAALSRLRAACGRMDGRSVLVTGATRGIGLETAVQLAGLGADVLVHGREPGRGSAALAAVRAASAPAASPALYLADLSSLGAVRRLAAELRGDLPRLDVLVANAGVFCPERQETGDSLELTFAVNVVAPVLLAAELLPRLRAAAPARVVIVSSASHWTGEIHWDDLQLVAPGAYDPLRAYDQSKLAVLMLTLALARRLQGTGVSAVCLDPGDVATTMLASGWPDLEGMAVEDGAVTSVYLASAPEAAGISGAYFEDGAAAVPLAAALDVGAQERLWAAVEALTGPLGV
jgi:NAD(P)-dependent dehydrogenase (short-subunit alcohol dehydrogenase family)